VVDAATRVFVRQVAGNVTIQANSLNGFFTGSGLDLLDVGTAGSVLIGGASGLGNTLFGPSVGFSIGIAPDATIEGNVLQETATGIYIYSTTGTLTPTTASFIDNSIDSANGGTGIEVDGSQGTTTTLGMGAGNKITGGNVGLLIEGQDTAVVGNTLSDLMLSGQTVDYIVLSDQALGGQRIDGTGVKYGGVLG